MALDVYFREDLARMFAANAVAQLSASIAHGGTNVEYVRGVLDNTRALYVRLGVSWPPVELLEREDVLALVAGELVQP